MNFGYRKIGASKRTNDIARTWLSSGGVLGRCGRKLSSLQPVRALAVVYIGEKALFYLVYALCFVGIKSGASYQLC